MRIGTPFAETVISKDGTRIGWARSGDGPPGVRDLLRQDTGAPCRIRTCDLVLRRHPLWSAELRGRSTADYKEERLLDQRVRPRLCDKLKPAAVELLSLVHPGTTIPLSRGLDQLHESRSELFSRHPVGIPPLVARRPIVEVE